MADRCFASRRLNFLRQTNKKKTDRWIIQPRDVMMMMMMVFTFVLLAEPVQFLQAGKIRNNAGGAWVKLEGKPPFLGHAAVAVAVSVAVEYDVK